MTERTIIYQPNQRLRQGWIATWRQLFKNITNTRELIWQLFRRDFFMSYKRSFVGIGWIFISPIIGIISWVFYNATGVLTPGDVGIPYPAYVLLSSTIFGLWGGFQGAAAGTLGAGAGFIMQVNYPHDALLVKQIMLQLANFLITFALNIAILLFFGVTPSWMIILFPLLILPMMFLGMSVGLIICIVSIVAPDIQRVINFILGLLMYVTPVIYSPNVDNDFLRKIIKYNPLTYLIGAPRDALIYGKIDNIELFLIFSLISFLLFLFSWRIFYVTEQKVIEKMI